jgi:hypothetical protein
MLVRSDNLKVFKFVLEQYSIHKNEFFNSLESGSGRNLVEIALYHRSSKLLGFFIKNKKMFAKANIDKALTLANQLGRKDVADLLSLI